MDNDRTRRGRPAAWVVFGVGAALLTGDALFALAMQVVANSGASAVMSAVADALVGLSWGQAEDARFEQETTVSVPDYLAMIAAKTGAVMELSCTIGATLTDAPADLVKGLRRIGHHLGLGFQVVDDALGIWGDPAVTGKPAHSDLIRRKKTLPILAALASGTPEGGELATLLAADGDLDGVTIARCAALVDQAGGRARAHQQAKWHHCQALQALAVLRLPDQTDTSWRAVINYLTDRIC